MHISEVIKLDLVDRVSWFMILRPLIDQIVHKPVITDLIIDQEKV